MSPRRNNKEYLEDLAAWMEEWLEKKRAADPVQGGEGRYAAQVGMPSNNGIIVVDGCLDEVNKTTFAILF